MDKRKAWAGAYAVGAAVLVGTSVASACTVWKGELSVTGNSTGTVKTIGKNSSMTQCVDSGVAKVTKSNPAWTIRTDPYNGSTCTGATSSNLNGSYKVMYYNNDFIGMWGTRYHGYSGYGTARTWETDCMTEAGLLTGYGTKMGTVTVNSSGVINGASAVTGYAVSAVSNGNVTFTKSGTLQYADGEPDESALCVSTSNASDGNQAPFTVV